MIEKLPASPLNSFAAIAPFLKNPLVLVGFGLLLVFGVHRVLLKSGLLSKASSRESGSIMRLLVHYGAWIAILLIILGFLLELVLVKPNEKITPEHEVKSEGLHTAQSRPSYSLIANSRKEMDYEGEEYETFGLEMANNGANAYNVVIECETLLSFEVWKGNLGQDMDAYAIPCDKHQMLTNPQSFVPIEIQNINMANYYLEKLRKEKLTKIENAAVIVIDPHLNGAIHLSYEDEAGQKHERYWLFSADSIPLSNLSISDSNEADFNKQKDNLAKSKPYPCKLELYEWGDESCYEYLFNKLMYDARDFIRSN